jgi:hypothetical protein
MTTSRDKEAEVLALIAQATALLPFVSEGRRERFRRLVKRLRSGTHGVGVGASFSVKVHRA